MFHSLKRGFRLWCPASVWIIFSAHSQAQKHSVGGRNVDGLVTCCLSGVGVAAVITPALVCRSVRGLGVGVGVGGVRVKGLCRHHCDAQFTKCMSQKRKIRESCLYFGQNSPSPSADRGDVAPTFINSSPVKSFQTLSSCKATTLAWRTEMQQTTG